MQKYSAAILPERVLLLGQRLQPLSIGHCLVLERMGNPFFVGGKVEVEHLYEAVYICCQTMNEAWASFFDDNFAKKILKWHRMTKLVNFQHSCEVFTEYKESAMRFPPVTSNGDEPKRELGTPYLLQLKLVLQSKLNYPEAEALSKPIGAAIWEVYGLAEMRGDCRVMNAIEEEIADAHRELIEKES